MTDRTEQIKEMTERTIKQYGGALKELAKGAGESQTKNKDEQSKKADNR